MIGQNPFVDPATKPAMVDMKGGHKCQPGWLLHCQGLIKQRTQQITQALNQETLNDSKLKSFLQLTLFICGVQITPHSVLNFFKMDHPV